MNKIIKINFLTNNFNFNIDNFFINKLKNFEIIYKFNNQIIFKYKNCPFIFRFIYVNKTINNRVIRFFEIKSFRVNSHKKNNSVSLKFRISTERSVKKFIKDELYKYYKNKLTDEIIFALYNRLTKHIRVYEKNYKLNILKSNLYIFKENCEKCYMISLYDYDNNKKIYKMSKNLNLYFSYDRKIFKLVYSISILDKKYINELFNNISL